MDGTCQIHMVRVRVKIRVRVRVRVRGYEPVTFIWLVLVLGLQMDRACHTQAAVRVSVRVKVRG